MRVYRYQHIDYEPDVDATHRLLLDTLNYYMHKYPCPDAREIFKDDTRSCFKTIELAEEFERDMNDFWLETEIEEYEESQAPEFYKLYSYEVDKNDIVFIDDFQVIHSTIKMRDK